VNTSTRWISTCPLSGGDVVLADLTGSYPAAFVVLAAGDAVAAL
jgi:hypothetical protein